MGRQRARARLLTTLQQRASSGVQGVRSVNEPLEQERIIRGLQEQFAKLRSQLEEQQKIVASSKDEKERLERALLVMRQGIAELVEKLSAATEENRTLKMPPLDFASIVAVHPDERVADISIDGRKKRVGIHASIDVQDLHVGQCVLLNGKSLTIQGIDATSAPIGGTAHINEWLSPRTALVEDSRGDKHVVLAGEGITATTTEPGTEVLIENSVITGPLRTAQNPSSLGAGSRFLLAEMPDVTFDDIGGLDDELARIVASIENPQRVPEAYAALKRKPTFSVILLGLPGNGKTMIAKAIARRQFDLHRDAILKHARGNFFAVGGTELFTKWLGDTERFLREIVQAAQRLYDLTGAVSTIFFDDCESFFLTRSAGLSTNINGSVVTQFSTLIEGVRELRGVNLIAATNRLDLMDPAVVRRFDRQVRIKTPDTVDRATTVLMKHLRGLPFSGMTTQEAADQLIGRIFAPTRENEIVEIIFKDPNEDAKRVRLFELISGKFLRDIVENAKELAIERGLRADEQSRSWTMIFDDLVASLHSELRNKESLPTSEATIREWLMQRGDKRDVESVRSLRDARRSDARREHDIDSRVV